MGVIYGELGPFCLLFMNALVFLSKGVKELELVPRLCGGTCIHLFSDPRSRCWCSIYRYRYGFDGHSARRVLFPLRCGIVLFSFSKFDG